MNFKTVEIEQNSPQWHAWRRDGIGSSDAPVIMGWNRYKTVEQLIDEKLGRRGNEETSALAQRGRDMEPLARNEYVRIYGSKLSIPTCVQSTRHEWLRASLDCANFIEDYAVEIKCGAANYDHHLYTRTTVPWVYDQVQHILAVTGFEFAYLWCWQPGFHGIRRKIRKSDRYISKLLTAERKFWKEVQAQRLVT